MKNHHIESLMLMVKSPWNHHARLPASVGRHWAPLAVAPASGSGWSCWAFSRQPEARGERLQRSPKRYLMGEIHPKIMVNWCDLSFSWNAKHMLPKMAEWMIVGTLFCVTRQTSYFLLFAMIPGEFARRNMMDSWCKSIIFIINA